MQDIHRLLAAARHLAADIAGIDVRPAEEGDDEASLTSLLDQTSELLDRGTSILDAVVECWDRTVGDDEGGPEQEIADLAATARSEISRRRGHLANPEGLSDRWNLIGNAGGCRRNMHKALAAVEHGICALTGLQPQIQPLARIETSLEIRFAYKKFAVQVHRARTQGASPTVRLRSLGNAMAVLIGRNAYPRMRLTDRASLRALQRRVRAWLAEDGAADQEAFRIEGDVIAFADLLLEVNHRAELVEHDARVLAECHAALEQITPGKGTGTIVESLRSLWGRHPELDALIECDQTPDVGQWCDVVRQLAPTGATAWITTDRTFAAIQNNSASS